MTTDSNPEKFPIDPNQSSLITDQIPEAIFHAKEGFREGPDQMCLVRLLKGIIPVSDILYVKDKDGHGRFSSYEIPLAGTDNESGLSTLDRAKMDEAILSIIFNDNDHASFSFDDKKEKLNVMVDDVGYAFFDFEAFAYFWRHNSFIQDRMQAVLVNCSSDQIRFLHHRLDALIDRFDGEKGIEFITSVVSYVIKTTGLKMRVIEEADKVDKHGDFWFGGNTPEEKLSVVDKSDKTKKISCFATELVSRLKKMRAMLDSTL
jgi:hypothetical protein